MRRIRPRILIVLFLACWVGCREGDPPTPRPLPPPTVDIVNVTAPDAGPDVQIRSGLQRAVGVTFGTPLPEGLELVERSHDVARFRTHHAVGDLVAFYRRELSEHIEESRTDGTKFTGTDEHGADVYVLTGTGEAGSDIVYFRRSALSTLADLELSLEGTGQGSGEGTGSGLSASDPRRRWRQGPTVSRDELAPEGQTGELQEGETARDWWQRMQAGPFPEGSRRLRHVPGTGLYELGNGQYTLMPVIPTGADGQPLEVAPLVEERISPNDPM